MTEKEAKEFVKKGKSFATKSLLRWKPDWDSAAIEYEKGAQIYTHISKVAEAKDAWNLAAEAHANAGSLFLSGKAMDQLAQLLKDQKDVKGSAEAYARAAKYYFDDGKPDRQNEALQRAARTIMPVDAETGAKFIDEGITCLERAEKHHLTGDLYPLLLQCYLKDNKTQEAIATIRRQFVSFKAMGNGKGIARGMLEIVIITLTQGDEILARRYHDEGEKELPDYARNEEWALAADLLGAMERRDEARLKETLKDPTFSFLNVEICRRAKKLKVSGGAPSPQGGAGRGAAPAPIEDDER